jgi:hypothetical protein
MGFFLIEKVHILRITHFSEITKDRNLIFGLGGDANPPGPELYGI